MLWLQEFLKRNFYCCGTGTIVTICEIFCLRGDLQCLNDCNYDMINRRTAKTLHKIVILCEQNRLSQTVNIMKNACDICMFTEQWTEICE